VSPRPGGERHTTPGTAHRRENVLCSPGYFGRLRKITGAPAVHPAAIRSAGGSTDNSTPRGRRLIPSPLRGLDRSTLILTPHDGSCQAGAFTLKLRRSACRLRRAENDAVIIP
jgi:hypothetical protein